ncbi:MAG: radical SAM protein [Eubacteriales bacterium]
MVRYSIITEKNPREIVLLRGRGCVWKKCTFCDYHLDCSPDMAENDRLNAEVLSKVTGRFHRLEVINSGSLPELGETTVRKIVDVCREKQITTLHTECHYLYKNKIPDLRRRFAEVGTRLKIKIGVETFDYDYREGRMQKGIDERDPKKIAENFNECCLLFGLAGQTTASMKADIETGLACFERVCVNIMVENTTPVKPDPTVIEAFVREIYPIYRDNPRVDILMENTDFGVGSPEP